MIDRDQAIREIAYRLWQASGQPTGRDLEFWLKAEEMYEEPRLPPARAMTAAEATPSAAPGPSSATHAMTPPRAAATRPRRSARPSR